MRCHSRLEIRLRTCLAIRHLFQIAGFWKRTIQTSSRYVLVLSLPRHRAGIAAFANSLAVVKSPEEAAARRDGAYDYVILCIKALPDVYDLATIIDSVVTPQHTCILINTTHSLGVEAAIEERFPTNVVLSLVSMAEVVQLGASDFEHKGSAEIWVGPTNSLNDRIPQSIREDMAQALAMTLTSGQVDCKVSPNIRQQQYDRLIGYVIFLHTSYWNSLLTL